MRWWNSATAPLRELKKEKELFLMAGTIGEKERQLLQSLEEQLKEFKGAGEELSWASWTHEGHLWVRLAYIYRCT